MAGKISPCPGCGKRVRYDYFSCPSCGVNLLSVGEKLVGWSTGALAGASAGVLLFSPPSLKFIVDGLGEGTGPVIAVTAGALAVGLLGGSLSALVSRRFGVARGLLISLVPVSGIACFVFLTQPGVPVALGAIAITALVMSVLGFLYSLIMKPRVQKETADAVRTREAARLNVQRMINTALNRREVDSMTPLDEAAEMRVIKTLIKQHRSSIERFRKDNRPEMAEKEEAELKLIEAYLPAAPSPNEVEAAVRAALAETGADSLERMGAVMKAAKLRLAGKRVDGKALSNLVRARLR